MKPINTSIFDFPTLIANGYVYVDKTAQIYELVKPTADRIYFFPRPRRFGKSLLISTLKALFQGRRELFRDLKIERTDWNWEHEVYPVLHLDMSVVAARDPVGYTHEEMEIHFHEHIQAFADKRGESYDAAFAELLAWYDSYQFSPEKLVKVINPVSLGRALSTGVLKGYWEATAGSTLVYDALKAGNSSPFDLADEFCVSTLDAADALDAPAVALLYQGGYLTIDRRVDDESVLLKIPNHEVRQSLEAGYVSRLLGKDFAI